MAARPRPHPMCEAPRSRPRNLCQVLQQELKDRGLVKEVPKAEDKKPEAEEKKEKQMPRRRKEESAAETRKEIKTEEKKEELQVKQEKEEIKGKGKEKVPEDEEKKPRANVRQPLVGKSRWAVCGQRNGKRSLTYR